MVRSEWGGNINSATRFTGLSLMMRGEQVRAVPVEDKSAAVETVSREKATSDPGSVGAPMSGVVVEVRVKEGQEVKKGDIVCGEFCE